MSWLRACADRCSSKEMMMKRLKHIFWVVVMAFSINVVTPETAPAQCAMCSLTAKNATENGNTQGKGINNGVLFLLAMPYLAAVGIGFLWYKKFRSKKNVRFDEGPIQLN